MMTGRVASLVLTAALALLSAPASAESVADFYRGKTINIICGFGPGGGYDLIRASWRAISAAIWRATRRS
jgi:tripartite-type tricarboxylate transporter receptor subunit TctC